jgi:membrane protein
MPDAVLLDVDGTLIDNNLLHVLAWSRAFRRTGVEKPAAEILGAIGMGGDRLVPALLPDVDPTTADDLRERHREAYVASGLIHHSEVLPGAIELLGALRRRGVRTALASSAKAEELAHYLTLLGGEDVVDAIVTSADVPATKPEPHLFAVALEKLGKPAKALVIGDTVYDIEAAKKLGLPCLAVLTGGIDRRTLEAAGPAAVHEGVAVIVGDLDRALAVTR